MLINRTFEEISLAFSGKTTAISLSIEIKRRLPMETARETSGRKVVEEVGYSHVENKVVDGSS
ncbi:hypothetical protein pdam_00006069 [Pocillopora damicornis]|uniref:Uncharacterized protein n=1 Tax=Pocillopora damicornis TaxID=46731 RepID=A0A3M6TT77_POCDA|nr:hypothetical protein pdam_00006069 [Pocillopora damicornis]